MDHGGILILCKYCSIQYVVHSIVAPIEARTKLTTHVQLETIITDTRFGVHPSSSTMSISQHRVCNDALTSHTT